MTENLQSKLVEILANIQDAASKSGDFVLSQLPDVVQQYLLYGRVVSILWFVLWLTLSTLTTFIAFRFGYLSKTVNSWGDWTAQRTTLAFGGSILALFFIAASVVAADSLLLVWLAPKVWLLQEFAKLVKQ